jgi:hypothetical protein
MITEEDFYAIAASRPGLIRAFCNAVDAVIGLRQEAAAARQSDAWADVRLKDKQAAATLLMTQFADGVIFNDQPISEDEKKLVQSWILRAAHFHLRPADAQENAKEDVRDHDAEQAAPPDIKRVA